MNWSRPGEAKVRRFGCADQRLSVRQATHGGKKRRFPGVVRASVLIAPGGCG